MTRVWIYTLGASSDPDYVGCVVPWRVDEDLIFFGPCMKRIREQLRKNFLGPDCSHSAVSDDLVIVGINASNHLLKRKIVWAGRLSQVMTFSEADRRLRGNQFKKLREHQSSPLHVRPILKSRQFVGYEHVSDEHIEKEEWVSDLVSSAAEQNIGREGRRLILHQGTRWQGFDRDCCMLLENYFFALGQGIEFDEEALEILRQAQPGKSGIDKYAIFSRMTDRKANGLRGKYLEITGDLANRFISWLKERSRDAANYKRNHKDGHSKTRCT